MKNKWLNSALFYEIYPTSFYDSNSDGIGDIRGIEEKLPYVASLGFNGIWINACFESPFRDGGYDVSDYYKIDSRLGTNEDMISLVKKAKTLGVKILLDLVIGHTSDMCEWFLLSKQPETNKYTDYYIWTDNVFTNGVDCQTVNGVVEKDAGYGINFFEFQPALNFGFCEPSEKWQMDYRDERLKPLKNEVINIIKFWLNLGVDGFRCDMADSLVKSDKTGIPTGEVWKYIFGEVRKEYPEAIFLSEWSKPQRSINLGNFDCDFLLHNTDEYNSLLRYEKGTNLVEKFEKGDSYFRSSGKGNINPFLEYYLSELKLTDFSGYISIPSSNHDLKRVSLGRSAIDLKIFYAFLFTFKTIPFLYYGDELEMPYVEKLSTKFGSYNRTGTRLPFIWDNSKNYGFSNADERDLCFPLSPVKITKENAQKDKNSLLNWIKRLISLRKEKEIGYDEPIKIENLGNNGYPLVYSRGDRLFVALNPKNEPTYIDFKYKKIHIQENVSLEKDKIIFNGSGIVIFE